MADKEESMEVVGGRSQLLLIRPHHPHARLGASSRRARGRSHGSERSLEEQEPGHWAAGDEHDEGNTTLTVLYQPPQPREGRGWVEGEEEAIPSIFSLRHPLGTSYLSMGVGDLQSIHVSQHPFFCQPWSLST